MILGEFEHWKKKIQNFMKNTHIFILSGNYGNSGRKWERFYTLILQISLFIIDFLSCRVNLDVSLYSIILGEILESSQEIDFCTPQSDFLIDFTRFCLSSSLSSRLFWFSWWWGGVGRHVSLKFYRCTTVVLPRLAYFLLSLFSCTSGHLSLVTASNLSVIWVNDVLSLSLIDV